MLDYKISVIIPVYNVEKYIERAMQSLLEQTIGFENLQIIFVDDCSTDKSWDIVCEFKNKYENVFACRLSKNSGSAGAPRNKALEFVKAKYVMFLDPDDIYYKYSCKILYDEIENNDVDFVSGTHYKTKLSDGINVDFDNVVQCDFLEKGIYNLSSELNKIIDYRGVFCEKIFKISLIKAENILFAENIPGEDVLFLCHYILASKKAKYIEDRVYCYILRQDSISFSINKKFLYNISKCYKLCYDLFIRYNKEDAFKILIKWLLDDYFNVLLDSNINEVDALDILKEFSWLCNYYHNNNLLIRSEYNKILTNIVLFGDYDLLLIVYENLSKIKKYVSELEKSKTWFLEQISNKDSEIDNKNKVNTELKNWIEELEKSKEWFLEQIEFKDKILKDYKSKNDKLMILKNYYEQPFYKRLFSKKPI